MGHLVTGRFADLEDALVQRVRDSRVGDALAPVTVVVGSAPLRTYAADLLVRRSGALANVSVVTLAGFALQAARRGHEPPHLLAGQARELLVRRLLAQGTRDGRLQYYAAVSERPHLPRALVRTFDDLREAGVAADPRWASAAAADDSRRAADLGRLYRAYCEELERLGAGDEAALYEAAVGGVTAAPLPGSVFLYGLYDLNAAQELLISALLDTGADAFVPSPPAGADPPWPLMAAARRAGCEERALAPAPPATDLDVLVGADLAGRGAVVFAGDGSLAVVSVPDERAEAHEAAREVMAALTEGAAAWDCAVVAPSSADVPRIAQSLRSAGLPVACRLPDASVAARTLTRLLDCLAPAAGPSFARRAVLDLLATAQLAGAAAEPHLAALWPDEARRAGIVAGPDQWTERLARRRHGLARRLQESPAAADTRADDEAGDDERARPFPLQRQLQAVSALEAAWAVLWRACRSLPTAAGWGDWAQAFADLAGVLLAPEAAAAVADLALRLRVLAPLDGAVGPAEAAAALREQLAATRVPVGRVTRDGVAVLTPLEARGLRFHTVVFTGLAEGGFPSRGRSDPILGDADRRRLMDAAPVRLPLADEREAEAAALFALACQGARRRLTLLAPRTEAATGRPRLPSRVLLRLAAAVAGVPVGLDDLLRGASLGPVWRRVAGVPQHTAEAVWVDARERDVAVLLDLAGRGAGERATDYLHEVLGDREAARRRLGQWRSGRGAAPGAWDGLLGDTACRVLAGRHPFAGELHPTGLERYITCPFAFYLRDVLRLEAPEEPGDGLEMDPLEFGTLAHVILQATFEAVISGQLDLAGALAELDGAWQDACDQAERRGVTGAALAWQARRDALHHDLREALRRDPVFSHGDGVPAHAERVFGRAHGLPVTLELGDGRAVSFAGRIDRVDVVGGGRRVVDYKTGASTAEEERLKDALSVQLPVYLLAVKQMDGNDGPVTAEYRMVTRRGGFRRLELAGSDEQILGRLRQLAGAAAALMDHGVFPRATRGRCQYCDLSYACGVSEWSRARKRGHDALAGVVALQSRPASESGARDA